MEFNNSAKKQIPKHLKPLFWSYRFETLDLEKDKRLIVKQILNYGTIEDWKWLVFVYGEEKVKSIIEKLYESEFRLKALKLVELIFKTKPIYASRGVR